MEFLVVNENVDTGEMKETVYAHIKRPHGQTIPVPCGVPFGTKMWISFPHHHVKCYCGRKNDIIGFMVLSKWYEQHRCGTVAYTNYLVML